MKFLIDNQLPPALAELLRSRGHDCRHVLDLNLNKAHDLELWTRCVKEQTVVVSKDDDFLFLANRPNETGQLIWVRLGNCRNQSLLRAFELAHDAMIAALNAGQRIIEIR
jgi:predicted nuclease of predicted toxin-antitoxin system